MAIVVKIEWVNNYPQVTMLNEEYSLEYGKSKCQFDVYTGKGVGYFCDSYKKSEVKSRFLKYVNDEIVKETNIIRGMP